MALRVTEDSKEARDQRGILEKMDWMEIRVKLDMTAFQVALGLLDILADLDLKASKEI